MLDEQEREMYRPRAFDRGHDWPLIIGVAFLISFGLVIAAAYYGAI